ncbi:hypothetical protein, partial [Mucilaginibacter sp. OK098]|uniref:hypothetical protein n=1 Tax=Mucilaginibacter sp. OK098 TaxID=1855297 RepID=UPI000918B4A8
GTATPAASSLLQVQKNTNGPTISTVVNNDPGANAKASFIVGSVPGTGLPGGTFGSLEYLGAGQLLTGLFGPDRTMVRGSGAGGLFLTAENTAGVISFATGGPSIGNQRMLINSAGNVGIGTTSPGANLSIVGNTTGVAGIVVASNNASAGYANAAGIQFNYNSNTTPSTFRVARIVAGVETGGGGDLYFDTAPSASGAFDTKMVILRGGNVGIGTPSPDARLTVNGTVHSTSVLVDLTVTGPDYVFKKDYNLPSLTEIKAYTDKNHHLPDVPAAVEMEKNGINLGEMNMVLLKKVEELTLYLIEKDRAEKEQKETNKLLTGRLESQQTQIDTLKKQLELTLKQK